MDAGSTRLDPEATRSSAPAPVPLRRLLGEAGVSSAQQRTHDCARPVRLRGATRLVNTSTGVVARSPP